MTLDYLLMMTESQIDYEILELSTLDELVRQNSDPFIATSALASQQGRDPVRATDACEAILLRDDGDSHLRAFVMTSLYSLDSSKATARMRQLVEHGSLDVSLLGAIVQNVVSDLERCRNDTDLLQRLSAAVKRFSIGQFSDQDEVRHFLEAVDA